MGGGGSVLARPQMAQSGASDQRPSCRDLICSRVSSTSGLRAFPFPLPLL